MKIENYYSPNFDKKRRIKKSIKILVIHYTGMQSERESINTFPTRPTASLAVVGPKIGITK